MRRRQFLALVAAGAASPPLTAGEIALPQPQRVLLTITGIDARTDAMALGATLAALVVAGVPVNLVAHAEGRDGLRPATAQALLVARYAASFPGLVEVVAWCPGLGTASPFAAARLAHRARWALSRALAGDRRAEPALPPIVTLACLAPLESGAGSAVLAAGVRTVLALPIAGPDAGPDERPVPAAPVEARLDRLGVLSLLGGEPVRLTDAAALLQAPARGRQRHLVIAARDLAGVADADLVTAAQAVARVLNAAVLDQTMLAVQASEVQMRTEVAFRRRIALHVLEPAEGSEEGPTDALLARLTAEGFPFSRGPRTGPGADGLPGGWWVPLELPADPGFSPDLPFGHTAGAPLSPLPGPGDGGFGIQVQPVQDAGQAGLTEAALCNIPVLAVLGPDGQGSAQLDRSGMAEGLVLIDAAAFATDALRVALMQVLRRSLRQPAIRLVTLPQYCAEVLPKDPLLPVLLMARHRPVQPALVRNSSDEDALMQDARAAWGYFETSTNRTTGLCPATTVLASRPVASHLAVSMWEAGSQLNALIAAVDLGLIPADDFTARTRALLRTVERGSRKRLVLPPETIDSASGKATARFNSFDTARLLIAMHRLSRHVLAPKGLADLVASWDFAAVIRNRRLHSWRERRLIDDHASNYADYAAAGMRLWGHDVASPMDDFAALDSADAQAALLARTVSFGLLGAEPCMLHLVEMPPAPVPAFLVDCVDALQRRLARRGGQPAAPSETPLDQAPWFTYQGFDLRRPADPWDVEFGARATDAALAGRVGALKATSSKAAYLWHALRPNRHSARLVETLRATARRDSGFDSALYLASQTPTAGYADLNTNAAILQAIAHILRPHP